MSEDRTPRRRPEKQTRRTTARQPQQTGRRLLYLALPLLLAGLLTYVALRTPWLTVQHVGIEGAETLDAAALVELSGLKGKSMLGLPLDDARERLLTVPQVKAVSFSRSWPQGVTIHVREREPVAFWAVGGHDYAVDAEGYVLGGGAPDGPAPRIVETDQNRVLGPGDRVHPDAIALARRIFQESPRFLGEGVFELEYRPDVGVTAVFENGLRVTFGDERAYEYKIAVLANLLDQLAATRYTPRAVDLRFGERVTYE